MDLRERLLGLMGPSDGGDPQLLHVARTRDVQHATSPPPRATGDATPAQQPAPLPREDRATAGATTAQPSNTGYATRLAGALVEAINRCCDVRGDDDANRQGLLDECRYLPPYEQADLRDHFEQEAQRWAVQSASPQSV